MKRISVDESVVRNHVTVMEDCSDQLRRDEQGLGLTADLNEREPYSPTDPGVRLDSSFSDALESYEASLAVMGDELLVMARKLTQLAGEVTAVDDDLADRLRAIADGIDGGAGASGGSTTGSVTTPIRTLPAEATLDPSRPVSSSQPVYEALPGRATLDPTPPASSSQPAYEALPARFEGGPELQPTPIAPEQEAQA